MEPPCKASLRQAGSKPSCDDLQARLEIAPERCFRQLLAAGGDAAGRAFVSSELDINKEDVGSITSGWTACRPNHACTSTVPLQLPYLCLCSIQHVQPCEAWCSAGSSVLSLLMHPRNACRSNF